MRLSKHCYVTHRNPYSPLPSQTDTNINTSISRCWLNFHVLYVLNAFTQQTFDKLFDLFESIIKLLFLDLKIAIEKKIALQKLNIFNFRENTGLKAL